MGVECRAGQGLGWQDQQRNQAECEATAKLTGAAESLWRSQESEKCVAEHCSACL